MLKEHLRARPSPGDIFLVSRWVESPSFQLDRGFRMCSHCNPDILVLNRKEHAGTPGQVMRRDTFTARKDVRYGASVVIRRPEAVKLGSSMNDGQADLVTRETLIAIRGGHWGRLIKEWDLLDASNGSSDPGIILAIAQMKQLLHSFGSQYWHHSLSSFNPANISSDCLMTACSLPLMLHGPL